MRYLNGNITR